MTTTTQSAQVLRVGTRDLILGSGVETLRDLPSGADAATMRARLEEDGYLLVRGAQDRNQVLDARRELLAAMRAEGLIDPACGPLEARPAPGVDGSRFHGGDNALTACPAFRRVVESDRIRTLLTRILGGEVLTFTYKWMRSVGPGGFTGAHYDVVYMGRGSPRLLTVWTPFGDLEYANGPLALVPGSHRLPGYGRVRETYGRMDVDRDRVAGWFADDPQDVTGHFGGTWATSRFQAGDVLIFGMYMMHMSLANTSGEFRLSADTRWQLASDPVDPRWAGQVPTGHSEWMSDPARMVQMTDKRQEWGV